MWTERERYIASFEEIKAYIEQIGFFHDHRVGNVEYDGKVAKITVEEIVPDKHNFGIGGKYLGFYDYRHREFPNEL